MLPGFSPFERNVLLAMYKDDYTLMRDPCILARVEEIFNKMLL
jgi:hypothetical protein